MIDNEKKDGRNLDQNTVDSFGDEWSYYDQSGLSEAEGIKIFSDYFLIFPWSDLPKNAVGFDMGCGSGRWAKFVAPRVGQLSCLDPSGAIDVAKTTLADHDNVDFFRTAVDDQVLPKNSQDFGYSLGVLHHIPDTEAGLRSCVDMLKPGAPFLLYLYYAFDNRSMLFKGVWKASELIRKVISRLSPSAKNRVTKVIALVAYFPLARLASVLEKAGLSVEGIPLSYYRHSSFYTMSTDARDRFGTPLEQRFTRSEIEAMMLRAGLQDILFSESAPYWCAVGKKKA